MIVDDGETNGAFKRRKNLAQFRLRSCGKNYHSSRCTQSRSKILISGAKNDSTNAKFGAHADPRWG
jgi:hypothetical protein